MLGFQDTRLFLNISFSPVSTHSFFDIFSCICTALFQETPSIRSFYLLGNPLHIINKSIHLDLVDSYEFSSWRARVPHASSLGPDDRVCTARMLYGALSRKRHGNRHAKPAELRVPVHPNLRKYLVKCSTSGGFFVNFYTLFFSTTSSILLRKV